MIRQTYQFEILTPCFCGGAEPLQRPEIRAASIRGQLRWWFRVLGGFKSLAPADACCQEKQVFGSAAGESGHAGQLILRVTDCSDPSSEPKGERDFPADANYILFPLRKTNRGVFGDLDGKNQRFGSFRMEVLWKGKPSQAADVEALITVFANLGALGFRSRRAMGALALTHHIMSLADALGRFQSESSIDIRAMPAANAASAIKVLANWLRDWRAHGRSKDLKPGNAANLPPENPGFQYAKRDHDIGYGIAAVMNKPAFRPALGLPIIQRTSNRTNRWEWKWNQQNGKFEGRFASPVLLRPHRDAKDNWHALVIFVDVHKWPDGPTPGRPKQVFLNRNLCDVSLDLYEEVKKDTRLARFLP